MSGESGSAGREDERTESLQPGGPLEPSEPRPMIERLGLALIAFILALLFGAVAVASWTGGEVFLAVMGAIGSVMTLWVGAVTLFRG